MDPDEIGADDARAFLTREIGWSATDVEWVGAGAWSRCFGFDCDGHEYVIRFGRHREEAAVAHEPGAPQLGLDAAGKRFQGGVVVRRADDPGMQHAGRTEIVDEPQGAGHLPAQAKRLDGC